MKSSFPVEEAQDLSSVSLLREGPEDTVGNQIPKQATPSPGPGRKSHQRLISQYSKQEEIGHQIPDDSKPSVKIKANGAKHLVSLPLESPAKQKLSIAIPDETPSQGKRSSQMK